MLTYLGLVALLELSAKLSIFALDALHLVAGADFARTGDRGRDTDGFRILEVSVDRRDDHARFNGDQVDTHERDADPRIDDDTLVEYAIEYVD
jgi:hypothetical protein